MPLVYTTTEGGSPNVLELLTPANNIARALVQALTSSLVENLSSVAGEDLTEALDALAAVAAPVPIVSVIGSDLSAPFVMTLLPAGHAPGMYAVGLEIINRTAPLTGTISRTLSYSAPTFGATSATQAASILNPGRATGNFTTLGDAQFMSSGATALELTITPSAITGSPVTDFYASVRLVAA